jgi:TolA-binding protein
MSQNDPDNRLMDYIYDELTPSDRAAFEQAMANDETLRRHVGELQSTRQLLKRAVQPSQAPLGLMQDLIREARVSASAPPQLPLWERLANLLMRPSMATAALVVVVAITGVYITNNERSHLQHDVTAPESPAVALSPALEPMEASGDKAAPAGSLAEAPKHPEDAPIAGSGATSGGGIAVAEKRHENKARDRLAGDEGRWAKDEKAGEFGARDTQRARKKARRARRVDADPYERAKGYVAKSPVAVGTKNAQKEADKSHDAAILKNGGLKLAKNDQSRAALRQGIQSARGRPAARQPKPQPPSAPAGELARRVVTKEAELEAPEVAESLDLESVRGAEAQSQQPKRSLNEMKKQEQANTPSPQPKQVVAQLASQLADDAPPQPGDAATSSKAYGKKRSLAFSKTAPAKSSDGGKVGATRAAARGDYNLASKHYTSKRYDEAIKEFRLFLDNNRQSNLAPDAGRNIARSYKRTNRLRRAVSEYRQLLIRFPKYRYRTAVLIEAARLELTVGELEAARAHLLEATKDKSIAKEAKKLLARVNKEITRRRKAKSKTAAGQKKPTESTKKKAAKPALDEVEKSAPAAEPAEK